MTDAELAIVEGAVRALCAFRANDNGGDDDDDEDFLIVEEEMVDKKK